MKQNKRYLYLISLFISLLIISMPFHTSSVMADEPELNITNPGQACIEKNEKTHQFVELLDNGVISVLEKIFATLHAVDAVWTAAKSVMDTVILILYKTGVKERAARAREFFRQWSDHPLRQGMDYINKVIGCRWPNLPQCEGGSLGFTPKIGGQAIDISISAKDNIYTAMACLCLPAILQKMRQLKTIYQTYNCCVEESCKKGMSTEHCERQLDEQTCMYWGKGAMVKALLSILSGVVQQLLFKKMATKWVSKWPKWIGTIVDVANRVFELYNLRNGLQWAQQAYSDPTCSELGFDKLEDDMKEQYQYDTRQVLIDMDNDGMYESRGVIDSYNSDGSLSGNTYSPVTSRFNSPPAGVKTE